VAREAGLSDLTVARVTLAAHLFGLDAVLRRERGADPHMDPLTAFAAGGGDSGLPRSLRTLGRRALGLPDQLVVGVVDPVGPPLLRLVVRFMTLRGASGLGAADPDEVEKILREEGHDLALIGALIKAMEVTAKTLVR
jgi:hypothetical protein